MKRTILFLILASMLPTACIQDIDREHNDISAPCYPLVTIDPYTSIWAFSDDLNGDVIRHWSGKNFPLVGVVTVDGKEYRFLGQEVPELRTVVGTAEQINWNGNYVTTEPLGNWMDTDYDDSSWKNGPAAFGTMNVEESAKTPWSEKEIWVRRGIEIDEDLSGKNVYLTYSHDDDALIYVNGILVADTGNRAEKNVVTKLSEEVVASLKPGARNTIAAYCWNRQGLAILDFGLAVELDDACKFSDVAVQTSVEVLPTQTYYTFDCGEITLDVVFTAPFLPGNLDLVSRPVNYMSYRIAAKDGRKHDVNVYLEASPLLAQNNSFQISKTSFDRSGKLTLVKTGTVDQNILGRKGDDVRIDWGYFCMASAAKDSDFGAGAPNNLRENFLNGSELPKRECIDGHIALVNRHPTANSAEGYFLIGYDDIYSIQYFGENLRPYWNRKGDETVSHQFELAAREYSTLTQQCTAFDNQMMKEATTAGGSKYASLCALAYRQAYAAHKLCESPDGELLWLSKENFSNGSIGTVDITYPSSPLFLLYNTELVKGLLNHIFYYSESGKWTKPFAAHDVGTYPFANGQTYGGDMPVEESGNMIIVTAALAKAEGNADYAQKHWETLTQWTDYLVEYGMDPENQLCTDDFAGHFAHNTNLSIKAIEAIGAYAYMAGMLGMTDIQGRYHSTAAEMARKWVEMAREDDHYKLTFDSEGTWSQKYNLVWDKMLGLNLFPEEVAETEIAYYLRKQNRYGLPLDCRKDYTKTDWINWSATMTADRDIFKRLIEPIYDYVDQTEDRVPMSDWTFTSRAVHQGFQARSVVGGFFMKMLATRWNAEGCVSTLPIEKYSNPISFKGIPDPSLIKAADGKFYLYATENIRNVPIFSSTNLVDWKLETTAFSDESRPDFEPEGRIWAPDINFIGGKYVMYYAMSVWGGEWTCGIGVAVADNPAGPFKDHGLMFRSNGIGIQNCIDPCFISDNGKNFLFWGSFHGIYAAELNEDGLGFKEGSTPKQIAGTAYEGTYIHKRGKYYYLFASTGTCMEGLESTYEMAVGRAENLFGPYVDKKGMPMLENNHEILLTRNDRFVGTGHNSEIVSDDAGQDWILFHGYDVKAPVLGRILFLSKVKWKNGWPCVDGASTCETALKPTIKR